MKLCILIVSLWILKVRAECPFACNCTTTSVICVDQNLESVPDLNALESSPIILDFSGNQILFVDETDFDFPKSDEVKEIYLNNSGITDIGQGTFDNLENLQELYLGQNFLSKGSVPTNLIQVLDNMIFLDISNNYFNDDMPIIRSNSLEVLALVNSKISSIPENVLTFLPNLKLLLLQQNNIQYLSFEPFEMFSLNPFFIKLSLNPWKCNCENLKTFYLLSNRKYLETSEPYQCINDEDKIKNIFNSTGGIELITEECDRDIYSELQATLVGYQEVRDMVNEKRKQIKNLESQNETFFLNASNTSDEYNDGDDAPEPDVKEMDEDDLEVALPGNCWEILMSAYSNNSFFKVVVITTLSSFFIGFITGVICCKVVQKCRYKKLEQSSDSQVQLLGA